jgi:hypothetical protein
LVALVPRLLKCINAELDTLDVSTEERAPFLNACFDLQTAALRNRPDQSSKPAEPPQDPPTIESAPPTPDNRTAFPPLEILERDGKLVQYLGSPAPHLPTWRSEGSLVKQGNWIVFQVPGEETLCGRICGETTHSGSVLLFNSDWGYAVALNRSRLEQQLKDREARDLSATALFDEAAERALSQIAKH